VCFLCFCDEALSKTDYAFMILMSLVVIAYLDNQISIIFIFSAMSDPDAIWHCRSDGDRDEAASGIWHGMTMTMTCSASRAKVPS